MNLWYNIGLKRRKVCQDEMCLSLPVHVTGSKSLMANTTKCGQKRCLKLELNEAKSLMNMKLKFKGLIHNVSNG